MSALYPTRTSSLSIDSPTLNGHPSLRELHNLTYSPIDTIPLPSSPPGPIRPTLSKRTSTTWRLSSASGSNFTVPQKPKNVRYPIGSRMTKPRRMVDETDFYMAGLHGAKDEPLIKQKFVPRIRECMDVILDYLELNLRDQQKLPEFPSEFHSKIAKLSETSFLCYNMRIDTVKMYTVIHDCVKLMPHCGDVPFSQFSPFTLEMLNDEKKFRQALLCQNPSQVKEMFSNSDESQ